MKNIVFNLLITYQSKISLTKAFHYFSNKSLYRVIFLKIIIACFYLFNATNGNAADYESTYGVNSTGSIFLLATETGDRTFQIKDVPTGYWCEWYVWGYSNYPQETDESKWYDHNPNFEWDIQYSVTIEANIYDENWNWLEYHRWEFCFVPSSPSNVSATDGAFCNGVSITWNSVSGANGYDVYRSTTFLGNTSSTSYVDNDAPTSSTQYRVYAKNSCSTSFSYGSDNGYKAITPSAPTNVSASEGDYCDKVRITWSSVSGATNYDVYRSSTFLGNTSSTTYDDNSASVSSTQYRVYARNNSCASSSYDSNNGYKASTPSTPKNVSASEGDYCDKVRITWSSVSGATSYDVYRSTTFLGNTSSTTYDDNSASVSSTQYRVYAKNSCGTSSSYGSNNGYKGSSPSQPGAITGESSPCEGEQETYSISPVSGADNYDWNCPSGWNCNCSGTSCTMTVGSGSGNVSVRANNSCGSSAWRDKSVSPESGPSQPGPIDGKQSACTSAQEPYRIDPVSGATSYTWTFPDEDWECISGCNTNSITATVGSVGNVCVTANNSNCSSPERCLTIYTVAPIPSQPGPIDGEASPCVGDQESYSVSSVSGATSYTWTLPDDWTCISGCTTTSIMVSAGSNSGDICVKANNAYCSGEEQCQAVNPTDVPDQPESIDGEGSPCVGDQETYTVSSVSGATSYSWTLPDDWTCISGCSTNSIIASVGSNSGDICVTADNSSCSSEEQCLAVSPLTVPSQPSPINGEGSPCEGSSQPYSITAVSGATAYEWTLPTGWECVSGCDTNSITLTAGSNDGNICVTAMNGSCESPERCLPVSPGPALSQPDDIEGEDSPCTGNQETYSVPPVSGATSYSWTWPAGWVCISGCTTNSATVNAGNNSGDICVAAENSSCTSSQQCRSVTPKDKPEQPGTITGESSPCTGSSQTYSIPEVLGATSYDWTYSGNEKQPDCTGTSCTLTPVSSGTLRVTAQNECGTGTARTRYLTVSNPPDTPSDVLAQDGLIESEISITWKPVSSASSYIIYRDGDSLTTRLSDQLYYTDAEVPCKIVTYEVYAFNGCKSETGGKDTGFRLGCESETVLSANSVEEGIQIYPNPAENELNIEVSKDKDNVQLTRILIYNALGQVVISRKVKSNDLQIINISGLDQGIYFLRLVGDDLSRIKKFLVEKH